MALLTRFGSRSILMLLSGNVLGAAVGGMFFLVASWLFSLEEMGRYAVAISVQWVSFGLIGTGLSIATLRVTRDRLAADDRPGAAGVIVNALIAVCGLVLLLGTGAYALLSAFGDRVAIAPRLAVLAIVWAGARALIDALRSGLLAQQDFPRAAILTSLSAATGLLSLVVALTTGGITVDRLLVAHAMGLSAGALAGLPLLASIGRDGIRRGSARTLLEYARWPALSEGARLLQVNLGPLLLVGLAGPSEAGRFGMGRYPAYFFDVIAVTLYQYWLTRAIQISDRSSLRGYLKRQFRFASWLGLAMIGSAVLIQPFLPLLGENFAGAGTLFAISAVDFAIILLIRPIETVFHGLHRPHLELLQRALTLPVLVAAALALGSRWGAEGMAAAHIIGTGVSLALGLFLVRRALHAAPAE